MTSRASPLGLGRIFIGGAFAVVTAACGGGSNAGAAADAGIVGTWGVTSTAAQGTSSKTDEAFLVYGSDGTARDLFRTTVMAGGVTSTSVHCGAGTYAYANGVVTSTIEEKTARLAPPGAPGAGMDATTTATVMASAKV